MQVLIVKKWNSIPIWTCNQFQLRIVLLLDSVFCIIIDLLFLWCYKQVAQPKMLANSQNPILSGSFRMPDSTKILFQWVISPLKIFIIYKIINFSRLTWSIKTSQIWPIYWKLWTKKSTKRNCLSGQMWFYKNIGLLIIMIHKFIQEETVGCKL